jgi:hypothetical protein
MTPSLSHVATAPNPLLPSASGLGMVATVVVLLIGVLVYFLPSIIAVVRRVDSPSVLAINLLLGWTGIGWIVAMGLAFGRSPAVAMAEVPVR